MNTEYCTTLSIIYWELQQVSNLCRNGFQSANTFAWKARRNPSVYMELHQKNRAFIYMAGDISHPKVCRCTPYTLPGSRPVGLPARWLGRYLAVPTIKQGKRTAVASVMKKQIYWTNYLPASQIQFEGSKDMDFSYCYLATFNRPGSVLWTWTISIVFLKLRSFRKICWRWFQTW